MAAIGYTTHIVAACDLPENVVYTMTKTMAKSAAAHYANIDYDLLITGPVLVETAVEVA